MDFFVSCAYGYKKVSPALPFAKYASFTLEVKTIFPKSFAGPVTFNLFAS
jgi:hypothetical protein